MASPILTPGTSAREFTPATDAGYAFVNQEEQTDDEEKPFRISSGWRFLLLFVFVCSFTLSFVAGAIFGSRGSDGDGGLAPGGLEGLEAIDLTTQEDTEAMGTEAQDWTLQSDVGAGDTQPKTSFRSGMYEDHDDSDGHDSNILQSTDEDGQGSVSYAGILSDFAGTTCSTYHCNSGFVRGRSCQCDEECQHYGSCCEDFQSVCKRGAPPRPAPPTGVFDCESDLDLGPVNLPERKGIALDDTTLEHCADQVPTHWPNTRQKILSVRLFKPWGMTDPKFFHGDRHKAWMGLKGFAQASGAKFLVGVSVTCRPGNDDREWAAGREFMKYVGFDHVMGIAVGNEIDLQVGAGNGACIHDLWHKGGYLKILKQRVQEFDAMSPMFQNLPITAVLSMFSMNGYPFKGTVNGFLKDAWKLYGSRFKFSINVYPQFSHGLAQAGCGGSINIGTKFSAEYPAGFIPAVVADVRKRLSKLGVGDMKIWLGEHGWGTHNYCVLCGAACHSPGVQQRYYTRFLAWDLSANDAPLSCGQPTPKCATSIHWAKTEGIYAHPEWYPGLSNVSSDRAFQIFMARQPTIEGRGGCSLPCDAEGASNKTSGAEADHVFYFTLRDSSVFGRAESFGIMERCGSSRCKFQKHLIVGRSIGYR